MRPQSSAVRTVATTRTAPVTSAGTSGRRTTWGTAPVAVRLARACSHAPEISANAALKGSGRQAPLLVNVSRGILYHGQEHCSYHLIAEQWVQKIRQALT